MEMGEVGDYIPIATLLPPEWFCIRSKMGSDENHFDM